MGSPFAAHDPALGPPGVWRAAEDAERAGPARFVAPGAVSHGAFGLFETAAPPGRPGAVPHFHRGFSESFHVLSGRLAVMVGDAWWVAGPGDLVHVPPLGVHTFRAMGDVEARFLILFVPGAPREHYFRGLAEFAARAAAGEPPTPEEVDAFAAECDQVNLREWPVPDPPPDGPPVAG